MIDIRDDVGPGSPERDTVLVLADSTDTTADAVCAALDDRAVTFFRFDTAEFPGRIELDTTIDPAVYDGTEVPRWRGRLRRGDESLELERVAAVYVRRPRPFEVPAHLSVPERWHAATESRYGLGGVLTALPVPYVNHPSASADAAYKPRQLAELARCGLAVPPTLVTNSGHAVRAFAARHGELICKSLAACVLHVGDTAHVVYTRRVTPEDLAAMDGPGSGIDYAAHLFQPFVPSAFAVRVIVVGTRMVAVRIDAHSDRARLDWRADYDALTYAPYELPPDVATGVLAYMHRAGLTYGAWDFLGHDDGTLTCLEVNPEGNYAWLEEEANLPVTDAVADFLAGYTLTTATTPPAPVYPFRRRAPSLLSGVPVVGQGWPSPERSPDSAGVNGSDVS